MLKNKNHLINFLRCLRGCLEYGVYVPLLPFVRLAYGLYVPSKRTHICERTNILFFFKEEQICYKFP